VADQPEERQEKQGQTDDETAYGVAEPTLGEGPEQDRKGSTKEAKYQEKHAYRV